MSDTTVTVPKREFHFRDEVLGDPEPEATPERVREILTDVYPELTNAHILGPDTDEEGNVIYVFEVAMGKFS